VVETGLAEPPLWPLADFCKPWVRPSGGRMKPCGSNDRSDPRSITQAGTVSPPLWPLADLRAVGSPQRWQHEAEFSLNSRCEWSSAVERGCLLYDSFCVCSSCTVFRPRFGGQHQLRYCDRTRSERSSRDRGTAIERRNLPGGSVGGQRATPCQGRVCRAPGHGTGSPVPGRPTKPDRSRCRHPQRNCASSRLERMSTSPKSYLFRRVGRSSRRDHGCKIDKY
jgi:hypothetical protein